MLPPQVSPVGGRLSNFVEGWKRITNDPYVLSIVAKGYRLRFTSPPLLRQIPWEIRSPQDPKEVLGMREQITLMLQKNAITEVPPDSPGFYSNVFYSNKISGIWTRIDRKLHINCLELKAVTCALQHWAPLLQGHQVMIATDNSTVVSYINKQGGTRSTSLLRLTVELFLWLESQDIIVWARHIPGCLNMIADHLSRPNQPIPTEWSLHPEIVKRIFRVWGTPEVDMFATLSNSHLPRFMSPVPEPRALAVDALSQDWQGRSMYVSTFSPAQQGHAEITVHSSGRGVPRSPLVAVSTVVPTLTTSLCGAPVDSPILSRSSVPAGPEVHLRRKVIPSARMEALMRHYKAAGFSDEVSRLAAAPRRPSTNRMYDDRWCRFTRWAAGQGVDPLNPTAAQVASFLFDLFHIHGLSPRTIKGYRTCIGSVLNRTSKSRVVLHRTISDMIASMELQRPRATPVATSLQLLNKADLHSVMKAGRWSSGGTFPSTLETSARKLRAYREQDP